MVIFMMVIAYFINPVGATSSTWMFLVQVIGLPLVAIAIACIPVIIVCYFIKRIPDIDYSIRLAFVYMLFLLVKHLAF